MTAFHLCRSVVLGTGLGRHEYLNKALDTYPAPWCVVVVHCGEMECSLVGVSSGISLELSTVLQRHYLGSTYLNWGI